MLLFSIGIKQCKRLCSNVKQPLPMISLWHCQVRSSVRFFNTTFLQNSGILQGNMRLCYGCVFPKMLHKITTAKWFISQLSENILIFTRLTHSAFLSCHPCQASHHLTKYLISFSFNFLLSFFFGLA